MKIIRITELSNYHKCPYLFLNRQEYEVNPKYTFLGTFMHLAHLIDEQVHNEMIEHYFNHFPDIKTETQIKRLIPKMKQFREENIKGADVILTETMFFEKYNDDVYIQGTPDIITKKQDQITIRDWKTTSDPKYYTDGHIREDSLQHYGYTYLTQTLQTLKTKQVKFVYVLLDKKKAEIQTVEKIIKTDDATDIILKTIEKYLSKEDEPRLNYYCSLCPLKNKCSLYQLNF